MLRDYASCSQDTFHAYADSTRPDDTGDGRTLATAKKTIAAAVALLPNVAEGHVVLHLSGTFTLTEITIINTDTQRYKRLIVDGGDSIEVLEGPYAATSGTTSTLTDSVRSWTINQWQGYIVEILDTSNIGHRTTIQSNTSDTLTVVQNWSSAITVNSYRIVRPATTITASALAWFYYGGKAQYDVCFQRLRFLGDTLPGLMSSAKCNLMRITDCGYEGTRFFGFYNGGVYFGRTLYDPNNPDSAFSSTLHKAGCYYAGSYSKGVSLTAVSAAFINNSVIMAPVSLLGTVLNIANGSLVKKVYAYAGSTLTLTKSSSSVSTKIDGSDDTGLVLENAQASTGSGATDISNCTTHGVELFNSVLDMSGGAGLTGNGNGNLGLYAHDGSVVKIAGATPPTVTGTLGDVAVNSTEQPTTWTNIVSNGGLSSAQEATTVKVS